MGAGAALDDDSDGESSLGQDGDDDPSAGAAPLDSAAPPPASQQGIEGGTAGGPTVPQAPQRGTIPTPDLKPEYDAKKLTKANNPLDILNAMRPKSRNEYMDWYEKTHGDIEAHYAGLMKQMGRPPEDEGLSRKEKFAALLEFGLTLMKNSAGPAVTNGNNPPNVNQGAAVTDALASTIQDTQAKHQAGVQSAQQAYDDQLSGIEGARNKELTALGTEGAAIKTGARIEATESGTAAKNAQTYSTLEKSLHPTQPAGADTFGQAADGTTVALHRDPTSGKMVAEPVTGIDGKPFKGRILGKEAGSGVPRPTDTAAIRNQRYLTSVLGIDENTATQIAFHARSGDPQKDHSAIYRTALSASAGDTALAQRAADQYVLENYGANALQNARAPIVNQVPPGQALSGLKPGQVRHFKSGDWTVGIDGKPQRVGTGSNQVQ